MFAILAFFNYAKHMSHNKLYMYDLLCSFSMLLLKKQGDHVFAGLFHPVVATNSVKRLLPSVCVPICVGAVFLYVYASV